MNQNTNQNSFDKNSIFSFLYRNRVVVSKGNVPIVNLSVIFFVLSVLCAPWLVIIGVIVALALGYRFSFEKNSADFGGTIDDLVQNAAVNVKSAVEGFTKEKGEDIEDWDGVEDHH